eukprot:365157-Chlamydomonas_euryale.AAC.7
MTPGLVYVSHSKAVNWCCCSHVMGIQCASATRAACSCPPLHAFGILGSRGMLAAAECTQMLNDVNKMPAGCQTTSSPVL